MQKAFPSSSLRSSIILLSMALALAAGACSVFSPSDHSGLLSVRQGEVLVWNDSMPGSRPRCNATLQLTVTNVSGDSLQLREAEAQIFDGTSGQPLRRFPPALLVNDTPARTVTLAEGDSTVLLFRSPAWGVEPIDRESHPTVRMSVRMWTSAERPLLHTSEAVSLFETK